jgi:hypothetical protein
MAVSLPSPWVDTGITVTAIRVAGSVRLKMSGHGGTIPNALNPFTDGASTSVKATLGEWEIRGWVESAPIMGGAAVRYETWLNGPTTGMPVELEHTEDEVPYTAPEIYTEAPFSAWYDYEEISGPYRLGVKRELIGAGQQPNFSVDYRVKYNWFADRTTTLESSFHTYSAPTRYMQSGGGWGTPQSPTEFTPIELVSGLPGLSFSGEPVIDFSGVQVQFQGLEIEDPYEILNPPLSELTTGGFLNGTNTGSIDINGDGAAAANVGPPVRSYYNLDVLKFRMVEEELVSGVLTSRSTGARLLDTYLTSVSLHSDTTEKTPQVDYLTVPYGTAQGGGAGSSDELVAWITAWERHQKNAATTYQFTVEAEWADDQRPPWPSNDRKVPIWCVPATSPPGFGPASSYNPEGYTHASYQPVLLTAQETLDVLRPDGNTPSQFVASSGDLVVTEGASSTQFVASATGTSAIREFVSHWREILAEALDESDGGDLGRWNTREDFRHNAYLGTFYDIAEEEDIWGWAVYPWLRMDWTASVEATLTVTVSGVHLKILGDRYLTNFAERIAEINADPPEEIPWVKTWEVALPSGASTRWLDLIFDDAGGPEYASRVDSIQVSGFPVGTFTLSRLSLHLRRTNTEGDYVDPQPYLKVDFGPPVRRSAADPEASDPDEINPGIKDIDFSALGFAACGSYPYGHYGDKPFKPEETNHLDGDLGGNLRYINLSLGFPSGLVFDSQFNLEDFFAHIVHQEGLGSEWDDAAYEAAMEDAYGSSIGTLAQDARPIVPYQHLPPQDDEAPDAGYEPACFMMAGQVQITNGYRFLLFTRHPMHFSGSEVQLASVSGRRLVTSGDANGSTVPAPSVQGEAPQVKCVRLDDEVELARGTADSVGYVVVSPIESGGPNNTEPDELRLV